VLAPYEFIAADATQDEIIATSDQVEIAKAIAGDSANPAYLGWEFVRLEEYLSFDDTTVTQPEILAAGNSDTLLNLNNNASVSFIGIKIGDLNMTCTDCYRSGGGGSRSGSQGVSLELFNTEQFELRFPSAVNMGSIIEVPIYAEPLAYLRMKVHALSSEWSEVIALQDLPARNIVYPDGEVIGHPINLRVSTQNEIHTEISKSTLYVLENPFRNELHFNTTASVEATVTIELLNQNGERMIQEKKRLYPGKNNLALTNIAKLPAGIYLLRLLNEDGSMSTKKIIKQ